MTSSSRRLIPDNFQRGFMRTLDPLVRLFTKWGVNPNSLTLAGVLITFFATIAFFLQSPRLGGFLVLLGGLCDAIDGSLARNSGKATRFGALLDSSVDRYAEFAMLFGIGGYFLMTQDYLNSAGTFLALCGSFMVSYTRARAESLGLSAKVGVMQRPERIVFLGAGALIHPIALAIAIWMVAVFANVTALQRLRFAFKQDSSPPLQKDEKPELKSVPITKGST
ncbi:MAG: CDP-alcohol phosphatidyltransferase family protein [Desulfobacterales bacterium]|jgi:CDP-diacylglycerol--glycerol-3-phosphate 3-phosphatidyltransferase|nr:CDP-alcohol phosphatidyltransferase family protein [Desulfobacterales bacterium]